MGWLLLAAFAAFFLLGAAIALNVYMLPRPRRFGFTVENDR